jgi:hypothetical protein
MYVYIYMNGHIGHLVVQSAHEAIHRHIRQLGLDLQTVPLQRVAHAGHVRQTHIHLSHKQSSDAHNRKAGAPLSGTLR